MLIFSYLSPFYCTASLGASCEPVRAGKNPCESASWRVRVRLEAIPTFYELEPNRISKSQTRVEPNFKGRTSNQTEHLKNFKLTENDFGGEKFGKKKFPWQSPAPGTFSAIKNSKFELGLGTSRDFSF